MTLSLPLGRFRFDPLRGVPHDVYSSEDNFFRREPSTPPTSMCRTLRRNMKNIPKVQTMYRMGEGKRRGAVIIFKVTKHKKRWVVTQSSNNFHIRYRLGNRYRPDMTFCGKRIGIQCSQSKDFVTLM